MSLDRNLTAVRSHVPAECNHWPLTLQCISQSICSGGAHGCCKIPVTAQEAQCYWSLAFISIKADGLISFSLSFNWLWTCTELSSNTKKGVGIISTVVSTKVVFYKLTPASQIQPIPREVFTFLKSDKTKQKLVICDKDMWSAKPKIPFSPLTEFANSWNRDSSQIVVGWRVNGI